ncbi:hypothetical protein BJY04DRAFT_188729 [Aspergillus karnatakaensis]|uniref:uncharacterized protein n=1 Tax=Aspergillus karnatakaensis TaxID=1810916 RepID=UPI003CCD550A
MVVFIDYDHDPLGQHSAPKGPDAFQRPYEYVEPAKAGFSTLSVGFELPDTNDFPAEASSEAPSSSENEPQTPHWNSFSVALGCYPIAKEIARSIDLSTLQALSETCRQFYANLLPYRSQLAKQTLRCENEYIETLSDMLHSGAAIPDSVKSVIRLLSRGALTSGQLTSGKISKCARDMVAECRGCSKVVCRNCTAKPPNSATLKNRIRRLCITCRKAPLSHLASSSLLAPLPSTTSETTNKAAVALRDTCTCQDVLWLCNQCGQKLRRNDTTYRRVWTWRTRYSTYLGGLGTGIGEGCQGVKCGRGENCLAAQEIELEVECEADESMSHSPPEYGYHFGHRFDQVQSDSHNHTRWEDPEEKESGYLRQEIIGIGGRVKQRAKKRVMVGACVVEHEDERESGDYLTREEGGCHRSWCGWCWRVVPAKSEVSAVQSV